MTAPIRSMPGIIRDMEGIRQAVRQRRDELNISHETIDALAGLQAGYTSKLLAPIPIKNFGDMSLAAVLGALAIAIVVVEDPAQKLLVEGRWQKRKRPQRLLPASASRLSINAIIEVTPDLQAQLELKEYMKMIGKRGGIASAKRRMKVMGKRARQRSASHAARMRWAKRAAASHA